MSNPTVVEGLQGKYIASIACGWHHTAALTDSGQLYTWGSGECVRDLPCASAAALLLLHCCLFTPAAAESS